MLALWKGRLPLAQAFWEYAIIYGTALNAVTTIATFGVLAADLPVAVAVLVFLLPLPYLVAAVVGVWRSADSYAGPPLWASLARVVVTVWGVLMVVS